VKDSEPSLSENLCFARFDPTLVSQWRPSSWMIRQSMQHGCFDNAVTVFVTMWVMCMVLDRAASRVSTRAAVVVVA